MSKFYSKKLYKVRLRNEFGTEYDAYFVTNYPVDITKHLNWFNTKVKHPVTVVKAEQIGDANIL